MADNLFTHAAEEHFDAFAPLAARMRPRSLDELVGQPHLVGPNGPLRNLITADRLRSIILWAPAGPAQPSRSLVCRLEPLSPTDVVTVLERALKDAERGLGGSGVAVDDQAVAYIVDRSGGDARVAPNALEATVAAALAAGQDKATVQTA